MNEFNWLDIVVIVLYFVGIIGYGLWLSSKIKSSDSYFRGDRKFSWWIMILPGVLKDENDLWSFKQTWDHDHEVLKPNYYSTYFVDSDIRTEFVPGKKAGFFKFHFPEKGIKKLKFNVTHNGSWKQ